MGRFRNCSISLFSWHKKVGFDWNLYSSFLFLEMCTKPFTVGVLQDIFDVSTKRTCEKLFSVVEYMIATWKSVSSLGFTGLC